MAITPIDLQSLYTQMGHLAKIAADQQNGVKLSQQLQESNFVRQNIEKTQAVKKTADNESKAMIVGKDGRRKNDSEDKDESSDEKSDLENSENAKKEAEIRETYLGNRINIVS